MLARRLLLCLFALALAGCLTLQQRFTNAADEIITLINMGKADELTAMTGIPFLLDSEIILLPEDMAVFWKDVLEAGFTVEKPLLIESYQTDDKTYREFGDNMDVESYFQKYVSKDAHIVVIETGKSTIFLIMDRTRQKETKLIGFKGPVGS